MAFENYLVYFTYISLPKKQNASLAGSQSTAFENYLVYFTYRNQNK